MKKIIILFFVSILIGTCTITRSQQVFPDIVNIAREDF